MSDDDDHVMRAIDAQAKIDDILQRQELSWTLVRRAEWIAAQLIDYAQLTGHSKLSMRDIMKEFDCEHLTANAAKMIYKEIWENRDTALDRAFNGVGKR